MSKKVAVILLEDSKLGRAGDIVAVAEGYARNALFPEGKAALASSPKAKLAQVERKTADKQEKEKIKKAQVLAEQLDNTELILTARAQAEGSKLFGSIKAKDIATELSNQTSEKITAKQIKLDKPIQEAGEYSVPVILEEGIEFMLQVTVITEGDG